MLYGWETLFHWYICARPRGNHGPISPPWSHTSLGPWLVSYGIGGTGVHLLVPLSVRLVPLSVRLVPLSVHLVPHLRLLVPLLVHPVPLLVHLVPVVM